MNVNNSLSHYKSNDNHVDNLSLIDHYPLTINMTKYNQQLSTYPQP